MAGLSLSFLLALKAKILFPRSAEENPDGGSGGKSGGESGGESRRESGWESGESGDPGGSPESPERESFVDDIKSSC